MTEPWALKCNLQSYHSALQGQPWPGRQAALSILTPVRATTHHSFRGSFSAVSTPIVMRNGAFFSIFQNLQEFTFFLEKYLKKDQDLMILVLKFSENSGPSDFHENSKNFIKMFMIFWKKCENRVDLEKR